MGGGGGGEGPQMATGPVCRSALFKDASWSKRVHKLNRGAADASEFTALRSAVMKPVVQIHFMYDTGAITGGPGYVSPVRPREMLLPLIDLKRHFSRRGKIM